MEKDNESSIRNWLIKWLPIFFSLFALIFSAASLYVSSNSNKIAEDSNYIAKQALDSTTINVETFGYSFVAESPRMVSPNDRDFFSRRRIPLPLIIKSELYLENKEETEADTDHLYAYAILENLGPGLILELELTEVRCIPTGIEELDGWLMFPANIGPLESSQAIALLVHIVKESEHSVIYESLPCSTISIIFNYIDTNNEHHESSVSIDMKGSVEFVIP